MPWVVDTGNSAVAYAAKLARVQVVSAYPITPQTPIVEKLASIIERGELDAKFIRTESEFSALAVCLGASLAGARAFTATSSHGLALMHELLHWTAGARAPVVMAVANRALGPPWSIWPDLHDMLSQRDTGWMQLFTWNAQEIVDSIILAYRVAESIRLPMMVGLEGFVLSHTAEQFFLPDQDVVDSFLPKRDFSVINFESPMTLGNLATPDYYDLFKYDMVQAMEEAIGEFERAAREYGKAMGREVSGCLEDYYCDERDSVIVSMGTIASEALAFVRESTEFGLLRVKMFRPFPRSAVKQVLDGKDLIVILERAYSLGGTPPLTSEILTTVEGARVVTFVVGIGGRDFTPKDVEKLVSIAKQGKFRHAWYVGGEVRESY